MGNEMLQFPWLPFKKICLWDGVVEAALCWPATALLAFTKKKTSAAVP